jgi:hypothetical protein
MSHDMNPADDDAEALHNEVERQLALARAEGYEAGPVVQAELNQRLLPLDLASLLYTDTVPTEPGWYAARCSENGDCIIMRWRIGQPSAPPGWQWGVLIAPLAPEAP